MSISLQKGQRISLKKVAPSLVAGFIGLGWDVNVTDTGKDFDLDASVFLLGANEKLISDKHFIFYNNLISPDPDQSIKLLGDNRTGEGEGDDEGIVVDLRKIPPEVVKIVVTVTIHEADSRGQNFGQVSNAYIRLVDVQSKEEVLRYDLSEDFSVETAIVMAELYNKDGEWRVNAVGSGFQGGLQALLDRYQ
jgi:tellurium resistance protein TerD